MKLLTTLSIGLFVALTRSQSYADKPTGEDYLPEPGLHIVMGHYDNGKLWDEERIHTQTEPGALVSAHSSYGESLKYYRHEQTIVSNNGEHESVFFTDPISIGNKWSDEDNVTVTILETNASTSVPSGSYTHCIVLKVDIPPGLYPDSEETLIEHYAPRIGLIKQTSNRILQKQLISIQTNESSNMRLEGTLVPRAPSD